MIVDIHNHILPNFDDGPKDWSEAILLAKQAADSGITHVFATPHHKHHHKHHYYENDPQQIIKVVDEFNHILKEENISLIVFSGIEYHLHKNIREDMDNNINDFLTLNNKGRYILIELPCHSYPQNTEETLYELKSRGFIPILVHPERNKMIRKNPVKIYNMVKKGILVQITAGSVTGLHGKRLKNFSRDLLDHNLVHFIASDAHHYLRRKFELISAYNMIESIYSLQYRTYLEENACSIVDDSNINIYEPSFIKNKTQYFFLYSHPLNLRVEQK
ncbi:tyrosine-protein phosphatase [Salipaludibacillus daqingensis]|uniref:tyrosine-protein phosphatase n=1 Tax=Salipaludibacillus daqingensis TaxID=3041001 RepID=UPI0024770971|nr:CpsB/CapC family capsule biosynthesis tyrosine phosphatase [Salipaludibacillus daqingensis]